jgi:hypothetical protein
MTKEIQTADASIPVNQLIFLFESKLTHVKQQQWVLFRTVKRICLRESEREHTLKHREQKNNLGVDWVCDAYLVDS